MICLVPSFVYVSAYVRHRPTFIGNVGNGVLLDTFLPVLVNNLTITYVDPTMMGSIFLVPYNDIPWFSTLKRQMGNLRDRSGVYPHPVCYRVRGAVDKPFPCI